MAHQKLVRRKRASGVKQAGALDRKALEGMSSDFQILASPVRLQILEILARADGEVCVSDLEDAVPVQQPTVSHHLRELRKAGLVDSTKRGLWACYFVNREAVAALRSRILAALERFEHPNA